MTDSEIAVLDAAVAGCERSLSQLLQQGRHEPTAYSILEPIQPDNRYGASVFVVVTCGHCRSLCQVELICTQDAPSKQETEQINQRLVLMMLRIAPSLKRVAMSDLKWYRSK